MRFKIFTATISCITLLIYTQAWGMLDINTDTPIHISADKMVSHDKEKAVIFFGNVKAKQGEMIINADKMTIYRSDQKPEKTTDSGEDVPQIKKIIATGNVEIIQEGFVATGDQVEYFAVEEKVLLTGHAKIIQDNNMVTGYQVEMDIGKGTTTVTPEKGGNVTTGTTTIPAQKPKVEMYFYPKTDKAEPK